MPVEPTPAENLDELLTEQVNPRTVDLDQMETREILEAINQEDRRVAEAVAAEIPRIAQVVDRVAKALESGGRLFYVGAGTSGRIGVLDASECPPTFGSDPQTVQALIAGGPRAVASSAEGAEDDRRQGALDLAAHDIGPRDVVVGIAASGRTPYTIGALEEAGRRGAFRAAVVNNPGSPMEAVADVTICPLTGPEVLTGSTRMKAGTSQKMVLNMISTAAMVRLGKVYRNLMVDMVASNQKLRSRARRIVRLATGCDPDTAARALEEAGGRVKVAIVALSAGVPVQQAEAMLNRAAGKVRRALLEGGVTE